MRTKARRITAWCLLALHAFTLTADGSTRYLNRSTGNNAASGLVGAPWRTVAYANAHLAAGETCIIAANDTLYDTAIVPLNDGTGWLGDSTDATHVKVPGANVIAKFTTFNGIKFSGAISVAAPYCHIRKCRVVGNLFSYYGALTCLSNQIGTNEGSCQFYIQPTDNAVSGDSCDIEYNGMALRWVGPSSPVPGHLLHWQPSRDTTGHAASGGRAMKDWTVTANRCTLTMTQDQNFEKTLFLSRLRRCHFTDNHWFFRDSVGSLIAATGCSGPGSSAGNQAFVVRDSMKINVFLRDTVEFKACNGPYGVCRAFIYSPGNNCPDIGNVWRYCVFKSDVIPCNQASFMQDWVWGDRDSVYRNTYLCNHDGDCLKIDGSAADSSFFERNTIVNLGTGRALKVESDNLCDTAAWPGYLRARGNLMVSNGSDAVYVCTKPAGSRLISDYNVEFGAHVPQNHAEKFGQCGAQPIYYGVPLGASLGVDSHSKWGSPMFEDSSYATFSGALGAGSAARGAGPDGVDAGAFDYVAAKPGQVTDLAMVAANDAAAVFTFTAPGANGTVGTVTSYDFRYSTSTITEANFASATPFAMGTPNAPGSTEVVRVTDLTAATTYYFALRASNGARVAQVSNVAEVHTWPVNSLEP